MQEKFDQEAMEKQARLREREMKAAEVRDSFMQFKRDLAFKTAENSRTGKPIPEKVRSLFALVLLAVLPCNG